jgi:hypothetical protein
MVFMSSPSADGSVPMMPYTIAKPIPQPTIKFDKFLLDAGIFEIFHPSPYCGIGE